MKTKRLYCWLIALFLGFSLGVFIGEAKAEAAPFIAVYGNTAQQGTQAAYDNDHFGLMYGIESNYFGMDFFKGFGRNSLVGADIRFGYPVGNFKFWAGAGIQSEDATVTDYSGNWDNTELSNGEASGFTLLQVSHKSGFFLRYSFYTFSTSVLFTETRQTGVDPKTGYPIYSVVNTKTINFEENRDNVMIGYKYNF